MSGVLTAVGGLAHELRLRWFRASGSVWAARVVLVVGSQVAIWSTLGLGVPPQPLVVAVVGLGALVQCWLPESHVGALVLAVAVAWWGYGVGDGLHAALLVAAGGLVSAHVAGHLLASGPETLRLDPRVVRRWVRRGVLVSCPVPVLWGAAELAARVPQSGAAWVVTLLVLLLAVVGAHVAWASVAGEDVEGAGGHLR